MDKHVAELSCRCEARLEEERYSSGALKNARMYLSANEGCDKSHDFLKELIKAWNARKLRGVVFDGVIDPDPPTR